MSSIRTPAIITQNLSASEVKAVLEICDARIAKWKKWYAPIIGKENNCYINIMTAMRDYLDAWLHDTITKEFISNHTAVTDISDCDISGPDAEATHILNNGDLERIKQIADLSFMLSNSDLTNNAFDVLEISSRIENPSVGFKRYLANVIVNNDKKWANNFPAETANALVSDQINFAIKQTTQALVFLGSGAFVAMRGKSTKLASVVLAAGALHQVSGVVSDKIALTFFANKPEEKDLCGVAEGVNCSPKLL